MFGQPAKSTTVTCPHCKAEVEQTPGAGRVKLYCSVEHGRAWRRRMRHAGWL